MLQRNISYNEHLWIRDVLILGGWNRGIPLYTEVSSLEWDSTVHIGVLISGEGFHFTYRGVLISGVGIEVGVDMS